MHAAGPDAGGVAHGDEAADLAHHVVEAAGLEAARVGEGVAVHRVAHPHDRLARVLDRLDDRRQLLGDGVRAHAADEQRGGRAWRRG